MDSLHILSTSSDIVYGSCYSHVHAAHASFLWDTEEGEDGCNESQCLPSHLHLGAIAN